MNRLLAVTCLAVLIVNCRTNPVDPVYIAPVIDDSPSVSMKNYGAVVPYPVTSTIRIQADSVYYTFGDSISAGTEWSKATVDSDFDSLMALIYKENIIGMTDPAIADSGSWCAGWKGELLIIKTDTLVDSIEISGIICYNLIPENLKVVRDAIDSLMVKYGEL